MGVSINLIPLSIYKKLGLGEIKPTMVTLQLAKCTITYPRGIIKDVLVKVDKFIFPTGFIILDKEEDREVSIMLRRLSSYSQSTHRCREGRAYLESLGTRGNL